MLRKVTKAAVGVAVGVGFSIGGYCVVYDRQFKQAPLDAALAYNQRATRDLSNEELGWIKGNRPSDQYIAFDALTRPGLADRVDPATYEYPPLDEQRTDADFISSVLFGDAEAGVVEARGVVCYWSSSQEQLPGSAKGGVILHFHGGGYSSGSVAEGYTGLIHKISSRAGRKVLSVDFRLAPETPLPAAVEDGVNAYKYLTQDLGVNPESVCLLGESSGGSLAILVMQAIRDQGLAQPACGVAISPWADLSVAGHSFENCEDDVLMGGSWRWLKSDIERNMAQILGSTMNPKDPRVSPVYASCVGLAPLYITVGSSEVFLGMAKNMCSTARKDGCVATLEIGENMCHCYTSMLGMFPEADASFDNCVNFMDERISK